MLLFWIGFNAFILAMLALDLFVVGRRGRELKLREAVLWSVLWIALAFAFALIVYFWHGRTPALQFVTGYIIEVSLSADNLFLFLLIFRYFNVPGEQQHRVLFWGIIGALAIRGLFIAAGVELIQRFDWITYVFGAFLVYSGAKLLRHGQEEINPDKNPVLRLFRRFFSVTKDYENGHFFVRRDGWFATPLFVVLLVVETTDVILAVDSVPAVLAVTLNAFIVYTSNVFAILGLRSMYFALSGLMDKFQYLHYGLSLILIFVGLKMLGEHYIDIPTEWTLGTVIGVLIISVAASRMFSKGVNGPPLS